MQKYFLINIFIVYFCAYVCVFMYKTKKIYIYKKQLEYQLYSNLFQFMNSFNTTISDEVVCDCCLRLKCKIFFFAWLNLYILQYRILKHSF